MRSPSIAVLLLALAACSAQKQDSSAPDPCIVEADPGAGTAGLSWYPTLPGEVRFDVPAHLRSDEISITRKGATRRRLTFELLSAEPQDAQTVVSEALVRSGYSPDDAKPGAGGKISIQYRKPKSPSINVVFFPELAKQPANPDAKSMVSLSWQIKPAPKKGKTDL